MGPLPIDSSNIFSLLTFWFAVPLLKISTKRPLTEQDLWGISEKESAEVNVAKLRVAWEKELKTKNPSFLYALFKANLSIVMWSVLLISIWCGILIFIPVYLVRNLVLFVQAAEYSPYGWGYAAGFFGASLLQSILLNQLFWLTYRIGSRMRSGAAMLVYEKALRVKSSGNIGEVANLVSSDCQRLLNFGWHFNFVWTLPVVVGVVVGWVGVIGMVFMFLMAIWQLYTGRLISDYKNKATQYTDKRVQLMSEILIAIKLVKFYAWEVPFATSVTSARAVEVRQIRNLAFLRATNFILMFVTSPFTVLLVFAAYVALGNTLEAETAFVALALINSVSFPMTMLPIGVAGVAEGRVASKRIQKFLKKGELQPRQPLIPLSELSPGSPVIEIVDGEYSWENVEIPTLRNINLQVPQGKLIAVVGPVGSGKSTLISAIMEQVTRIKGSFKVFGTMSYVPQQAWIQNMTVRDNILFGKPYDEKKYRETIQACALEPDLKQFIAGDQTEIGERGINLSGGQKQRVSIARAVYAGADIILLDDPLSAVDQHVGKHLFDTCIRDTLRDKTIILVTHQLQYLPQCDSVVLMSGGTISAQGEFSIEIFSELSFNLGAGTFNELMSKVDFSALIGQHVDLAVEDDGADSTQESSWRSASKSKSFLARRTVLISEHVADHNKQPEEDIDDEPQNITNGKLTKAEERKQGSVASETYKQYIISGGAIVAILVLLLHILSQGAYVASFWWLTYLTAHPEDDKRNIGIYAILVASVLVLCTARELLYQSFTLRASTNIHNLMFRTILRAPMAFFDRTPLGRIINRFAADMDIIDYLFPDISMNAIHTAFLVLGVLVLVSVILHWMPLLLLPMAAMYLVAQHFYRKANRDIKRIDSASKSPLFQHVSATLQGLSVLRAFRQESVFAHQNLAKVDHAVRTSLHMYMIQRWLGFILDCIVTLLVFSTAALCVGFRDTINASQAGLVVTYVMQLADNFQWTIRTIADSEAQMTSVERLLDYCNPHLDANNYKKLEKQRSDRLAYEAPPIIPDNRPPVDWPSQGIVKFDNVTIEYTPGAPILRNLSFETRSMEKIGIVGRTGAGKSTVTLALFRIMECSSGQILIDNQNISLIGTHDLRSKIGIIPQDPVLFEGTIRSNLDPFGMYEDKDIWRTLKQVHLDGVVSAFPQKLDALVEINGENWSIGQRQLICIGRALLKHCKVLVLDEATAAVDLETDSLIQETIRENFSDCTILTIAHRLNTIIDSDRVMVLDKGQMVEFESPHVLLKRENGIFRKMVEKMGPAAFSRMATMSQNSFYKAQQQIRKM